MNCDRDDLGNCCGKCENKEMRKIVAVIPVFGRRPLVKLTIERLLKKNGVHNVICVGDVSKDERVCKDAGAEWVTHPNKTLAAKWNAGFLAAKKYKPDACLFVGSSDWISDTWVPTLGPLVKDFDLIGLPGCYLLDINMTPARISMRAVHWPGYKGPREGESIGIGRIISARILDRINWQPFENKLDHSLDFSMQTKVLNAGGKLKLVKTDEVFSMAISCNEWPNKHNFESHWSNRLPSRKINGKEIDNFVMKNFPEAYNIFTVQHKPVIAK
jgi:glycosyltransferase involved in cell wall biosynthesis